MNISFSQNSKPVLLSAGLLAASIIAEGRVQITKKAFSLSVGCEKRPAREGAAARKIKNRAKGNISLLFHLCALTHAKEKQNPPRPASARRNPTTFPFMCAHCSVYLSGSSLPASATIIHTFVGAHTHKHSYTYNSRGRLAASSY
jgi:hypothetical protein